MKSYDRLFPSQDTMPRGGFGNLIALPLQHGPRQQGNSLFLDERVRRLPGRRSSGRTSRPSPASSRRRWRPSRKRRRAAARSSACASPTAAVTTLTALRPGCGSRPATHVRSGSPSRFPTTSARCSLSGSLSRRQVCPPRSLNQVKRLAAFQNPEFYKKQSMRLSTATTPRVIACAEDLPQHVALPRGCRADLEGLLRQHGVALARGRPTPRRSAGRLPIPRAAHPDPGAGRPSAPRARHGSLRRPARRGQDRRRHLPRRCKGVQLACLGPPPAAPRAVDRAARRCSSESSRRRSGKSALAKRKPNGKLDVAMIQSLVRQGVGRGPRRRLRARHRRRVPPPARRVRSSGSSPRRRRATSSG